MPGMGSRVTEVKFHNKNVDTTTELHVPWEGRFRFKYADLEDDGNIVAITCWGGPSGHGSWRTFHPDKIKTVKTTKGAVR